MLARSNLRIRSSLFAMISSLVVACGQKPAEPSTPTNSGEVVAPKSLAASTPVTVLSYQLEKSENGQQTLSGNGKNNSDSTVAKAEAVFKLYDGDGKEIGETSAIVANLAPQFGWVFQAPISDKSAVTVKLKEILISN